MSKVRLKDYIGDVPDFPKPGILFKDISPLLASPAAFKEATDQFAKHWQGLFDAIVMLDARGFIFGGALALAANKPTVMCRKIGKLPGGVDTIAYDLEYGSAELELQQSSIITQGTRVLILDDLLGTGGTAKAACDLVEGQGGTIVGCAFLIELNELNGRDVLSPYAVDSLLQY